MGTEKKDYHRATARTSFCSTIAVVLIFIRSLVAAVAISPAAIIPRTTLAAGSLAVGRCRSEELFMPTSRGSRQGDENDANAVATARLEDQLAFRPRTKARSSLQESSTRGNGTKKRASGERRIEVRENLFGQVEHARALCAVRARTASSPCPVALPAPCDAAIRRSSGLDRAYFVSPVWVPVANSANREYAGGVSQPPDSAFCVCCAPSSGSKLLC